MKRIKRILCCALAAALLPLYAVSASDVSAAANNTEEAIEILQALDFISEDYTDDTIDPKADVSRAEFAVIAADIFNIGNIEGKNLYFHDIPRDHYAFNAVAFLTDSGIINVSENRLFEPDRAITTTEAVKIVIYGLGYGTYAEASGGYPEGVMKTAASLKLMQNVSSSGGKLSFSDMANLMYNALTVEILEARGVKNGNIEYSTTGETYLSANYDVYIEKGDVEGYDEASIGGSKSSRDKVSISGKDYITGGIDCTKLLGSKVKYVYRYDEGGDERTLLWIKDTGKSDSIELDFYKNDVEFDADKYEFSYYDGGRERKARLVKSVSVVYNGAALGMDINSVLGTEFDTMRLTDSDSDGKYDVAVIWAYDNYVVAAVEPSEERVYDKKQVRSISLNDFSRAELIGSDGNPADISAVGKGDVLSVYASKKGERATMYITRNVISGNITSTRTEGDVRYITIDGTEYIVNDGASVSELHSGAVKATLDVRGRVADLSYTAGEMKYGYIVKVWKDTDEEKTGIKLFSEDAEMLKLDCAANVTIDGVRIKNYSDIYNMLGGDGFEPQISRYELNDKGEIAHIDFAEPLAGHREYNETPRNCLLMPSALGRRIYKDGKLISMDNAVYKSCVVDSATVVFGIPSDIASAADDEYYIKRGNVFKDWGNVLCSGYSSTHDYGADNVLVVYGYNWTSKDAANKHIMVSKAYYNINDEGDECLCIDGAGFGGEVSLECDAGYDAPDIAKGDLITVSYNSQNKVNDIQLRYSPRSPNKTPAFSYDHWNNYSLNAAYAYEVSGSVVRVCSEPDAEMYSDVYKIVNLWVYDSASKTVRRGAAAEIAGAKNTGVGELMFFVSDQGINKVTFLYK